MTDDAAGTAEGVPVPVDLDAAINRVEDGFYALDRDWNFTYLNEAAARMVGRTVAELRGRNVWEAYPELIGTVFDERFREALETQKVVEFEEYFQLEGGVDAWFSIRAFPSPEGLTVVFRDSTRIRALLASHRALLDRLIDAEDRERARIAADVHDDSVQALALVSIRLQLLRRHLASPSPEVEALLDGLGEQVAATTGRLRALLFSLESPEADVALGRSIRVNAGSILPTSIRWSVDDRDAGDELPRAERNQVLRIVKEALHNVRAHARASEVTVTLSGDDKGLEIVVADDGVAVDPAAFSSAPGHRGLATMRDRAAVVGGWCTLEVSHPNGCTVRVYVPREQAW